ncbi:MAG: protoheme IX farnesyltransferase, partial [Ignavibacteriales bacterium]
MTKRTPAATPATPKSPALWSDYVQLLKPRVMSLVVFTAFTGLVMSRTPLHPVLAAVAVLCIAVGAGASGA